MEQQEADYLNEIENELRQSQKEKRDLAKTQLGMYEMGNDENNLIKWQLNLEEEKDRIFHLLKGHRKVSNEKGEEVWIEPLTQDSVIMNDYGIDYIMGLLESFVNRNIILSNWDEDRIKEICLDLGNQINEDIYNDYERMGLNTDDKRKKFAILVWKVLINIEASLRRAIGGRENLNLRKIITVNQNENPLMASRMSDYPVVNQPKKKWYKFGQ